MGGSVSALFVGCAGASWDGVVCVFGSGVARTERWKPSAPGSRGAGRPVGESELMAEEGGGVRAAAAAGVARRHFHRLKAKVYGRRDDSAD